MQKPEAAVLLRQLILTKETECNRQRQLVSTHFRITSESLKPIHLLKSAFKQLATSPDIKTLAANAVIGFASGFAAKKLSDGNSNNPTVKLLGVLIETVVANKAKNNADGIKSTGNILIKKIAEQFYSK